MSAPIISRVPHYHHLPVELSAEPVQDDSPTFGRFPLTSDQPKVFCGICRNAFENPHIKALHLRVVHLAQVRSIVDPEGIPLYEWRRTTP